jgi:hypothetical protein
MATFFSVELRGSAGASRTVLTHHGSYEAVPMRFRWPRTRSRLIYQLSARKADTVITVSESSKTDIVRFYGVSPAKIRVISMASMRPSPAR